ncbi:hypothetical protein [Vibrio owensii]|uniref:hypothetical protein n=1 Tax=Vibrio owensii TaxID=696485 RepID=UPI0018F14ECF|nr:hypothetical protein [Vibrio owensii]
MVIDFNEARRSRGLEVVNVENDSDVELQLPRIPKFEVPDWAHSVIIATLTEEDSVGSDPMSDYYRNNTKKSIVLGYSKHGRRLFSELRKMCLGHPDTEQFAGTGVELREDYTYGKGLALVDPNYVSCGWLIKKHVLQEGFDRVKSVESLLSGEVVDFV